MAFGSNNLAGAKAPTKPSTSNQTGFELMPAAKIVSEPGSGNPRTVFGYLRMEEPNENEIALMRKDISRFCMAKGFRLGAVFCDRGVGDDAIARTGFTGLLDVLRLAETHGVVVPMLEHLSSREVVRAALSRMIRMTASKLFVVHEPSELRPTDELGEKS